MNNRNHIKSGNSIIPKCCFLLFLFLVQASAFSQPQKFYIGLESGINQGNFKTYRSSPETIGYSGGILFQYNFIDYVAIKPTVSYKRCFFGSDLLRINDTLPNGEIINSLSNYKYTFDYIYVVMNLHIFFPNERNTIYISLGPTYSYLFYKSLEAEYNSTKSKFNLPINRYKSIGASMAIGVEAEATESVFLSAELRFCANGLDKTNNKKIAPQTVSLLVSAKYMF